MGKSEEWEKVRSGRVEKRREKDGNEDEEEREGGRRLKSRKRSEMTGGVPIKLY